MTGPRILLLAALTTLFDATGSAIGPDVSHVTAGRAAAVLEMDPRAIEGLESRGLALANVLGGHGRSNDALAELPLYASFAAALEADLDELASRPGIGPVPLRNHAFKTEWLRDPLARFELIGASNRLDRRFDTPGACGEARLIYRLVREAPGRPATGLPMTVSVVFPQPADGGSCKARAQAWEGLPRAGKARVDALASLFRALPPFVKVETNLQNLHGASQGAGSDDHAEYLLRAFERRGETLVPGLLLDTPREDLDAPARAELAAWVRAHFAEIDAGGWVIPDRFLATRAVSVAPRGMARTQNRPFATLFGDGAMFADLPYDTARLVKSRRGLLRRLDQGSCQGCHATRSIAGFHLLGESRDPEARLNALAVARSTHVGIERAWRNAMVTAVARGDAYDAPRPFAERRAPGPGGAGSHCGLDGDPTFAGWTCDPGLRCRDLYYDHDAIGVCAPADGDHPGDACEPARTAPTGTADGDRISTDPMEPCITPTNEFLACSPNWFGFPGGMCAIPCEPVGSRSSDGRAVCIDLPQTGFEDVCMTARIPIEACIPEHSTRRAVRACDEDHPCRDDFACGRIPGLPASLGACVPPYFVFQTRVDGPVLDR